MSSPEIAMFCNRLFRELAARNIKQKEFAEMIGVSEQTVSAYVKSGLGRTGGKYPSFSVALKIADALGLSMDDMCGRYNCAKNAPVSVGQVVRLIESANPEIEPEPNFVDEIAGFYKSKALMAFLAKTNELHESFYESWLSGQLSLLDTKQITGGTK